MAEANKNPKAREAFVAETQRERWVKYGANVLLTCVIVAILTGFLVYIAGRANWRKDTTAAGAYSLKPQSVRLFENLPPTVTIVGLVSKAPQEAGVSVDPGNLEAPHA